MDDDARVGKFFIEVKGGDVRRNGEIIRVTGKKAVVKMPDALVSVGLPFVPSSFRTIVTFKTVRVTMKEWEVFDTHEAMCARIVDEIYKARQAAREIERLEEAAR